MYSLIKDISSFMTLSQKRRFFLLQAMVIVMAVMEVAAISSIAPFMSLISDVSLLHKEGLIGSFYVYSGMDDEYDFIFYAGLSVLIFLVVSACFSIFTFKLLSNFGASLGVDISDRLYQFYLNQSWLFHSCDSSARLTKQISVEALRLANSVIQPLLQMCARIALALLISIGLVIYNPIVAFAGIFVFLSFYVLIYFLVRIRLQHNGQIISDINTKRFRLMNEGYGGIKDIILLGVKSEYINNFRKTGLPLAKANAENMILGFLPRYVMELIAFGSMILVILFIVKTDEEGLKNIFPIIALYALAALKLLPALQQSYHYLTIIKGNISAFYAVREDLVNSFNNENEGNEGKITEKRLIPKNSILLSGINFTYPGKSQPALKNLSIEIMANQSIGIVGSSGSGKSTCIDVLLGLIKPEAGLLKVDGVIIDESNMRAWQNSIGFVPQSIFLSEGSIIENIAFGVPRKKIDEKRVNDAVKQAHLTSLIDSLPDGLNSKIGERGVQLSGGQRQRIGIARALYNQSSILVFDEATSALDGITENVIMEAIRELQGIKTIILIAHRLKTIKNCDQIFFIDKGTVVDKGTYIELIEGNEKFEKMAKHS